MLESERKAMREMREKYGKPPNYEYWTLLSKKLSEIDIETFPYQYFLAASSNLNCRFFGIYFQISANRATKKSRIHEIHVDCTMKGIHSDGIYREILSNVYLYDTVRDHGFLPVKFSNNEQDRTFSKNLKIADRDDKNDWPNQHDWLASNMILAYEIFGEEIIGASRDRYGEPLMK